MHDLVKVGPTSMQHLAKNFLQEVKSEPSQFWQLMMTKGLDNRIDAFFDALKHLSKSKPVANIEGDLGYDLHRKAFVVVL